METDTRDEGRQAAGGLIGLVTRVDGIACTVLLPDGQVRRARLAGRAKRGRLTTAPVAVGDQVEIAPLDEQFDVVRSVLPRRTELARGEAGGGRLRQVIAANLDLLVIVFATRNPAPSTARLDRFLIIAEQAGIPPLIVVNKADLAEGPTEIDAVFRPYRDLGYPVLPTSAVTGQNIAALRDELQGRISALVGASGVGKSTLLNAIQPGLRLRTGEVSQVTGKGRHTTTASDLLPLTGGGYVADTPGLKELAIHGVSAEALPAYFVEFRSHLDDCYFARCTHLHEPGCAVRAAVEEGQIAPARYQSYVKLREELAQAERPAWA